MRRQKSARSVHASLHFVQNEDCAISRTQILGAFQITGIRQADSGFRLNGLREKSRVLFGRQLFIHGGKVVEWNGAGARQHRAELAAPEIVSHQKPAPSRCGPRELNRAFYSFAAGTGEESFVQLAARQPANALREFSRQVRDVALQHRRAASRPFLL